MLKENIGYIKISKFSKTTFNEFKAAVESLKQSGMESLVLDLRGNSGGYLDAATRIADQFLDRGNLIVYTKGRMRSRQEYRANQGGVVASDKVVVLIDEWSASASEILAGAIQDNDRGTIVGRRSFGKGLVQEPFRLFDGSAIRLTTARYYTPTGRCIQKPYKKGSEDYYHELQDRYEKGEFLEKDSIHFADSLKYMTPGGKIVYGGGGIMPDVFVPLDTSSTSEYLTKIKNKGLIYKYAFQYADQKREILSEIETYQKMVQYLNNQNVLNLFVDFAQEKGIQPIPADIAKSKELLEIQLNAYIIRNILDNEGFYPVIHRVDNTLKKAIELAED